jgi:hypothetical protein
MYAHAGAKGGVKRKSDVVATDGETNDLSKRLVGDKLTTKSTTTTTATSNAAATAPTSTTPVVQSSDVINASECILSIRMLDGSRYQCGLPASASVASLHEMVASQGVTGPFVLLMNFPRRVFRGADATNLRDAGLLGRNQLIVGRE